jgi:tetratricopeptide (TPR) repeat protein
VSVAARRASAPLRPLLRDAGGRLAALPRPGSEVLWTLGLGLLLAAITLRAGGGLLLGRSTQVEMGVQIAGGVLGATALLVRDGGRLHGAPALLAFGVLVAVTATSVWWSVNPSDSWLEANRTMAYAAAFGCGIALARLVPHRWSALIGATVVCATVISGYAMLTKILPGTFAPDEVYARLREPFGYWNAVGLMAALGVPGALWLAARRHGHAAISALAYPILGLLIVTVLLAYSRGSLLALVVGCGVWFGTVPLRLRGVTALAAGALGASVVSWWVFAQDELTKDDVPLDVRASAGHQLGLALAVMLLVLLAVGLASLFFTARRPPDPGTRRQAGTALIVGLLLMPVALAGALALSEKGLGGSISSGWKSLTDPNARLPANDPGRLTAVGSVRARYWDQAIKIFRARKTTGVGAGGYATARPRFRTDDLAVRHAHGYLVQTAADLGLLGLAASLALVAAWLAAMARTLALRAGWQRAGFDAERVGLFTLASIVVVFGVHSLIDFTWFVPGVAILALVTAGWLAGRGPSHTTPETSAPSSPIPLGPATLRERIHAGAEDRRRLAAALGILVVALGAAWATWQPERSFHTGNEALSLIDDGKVDEARDKAIRARDLNPLSIEPLFERSAVEVAAGRKDEAAAALEQAVRLQPSNPVPWLRLAEFKLATGDAQSALNLLGPALYLDPRSTRGVALFLEAQRATGAGVTTP